MVSEQLNPGDVPSHPEIVHHDWPYRRSAVLRYGVAVALILVAFAMRYVIYGDLNNRLVFTFFVPAAMIAAWFGGLRAGMLATLLGLILGAYFFLHPSPGEWRFGNRELMVVGVYTLTTMLCVILCENLHYCIRRLEHALERERHHSATSTEVLPHEGMQPVMRHRLSWPYRRSYASRYGVAIGVVLLAFGLRYSLFGAQDHRFPFIFFVPAAMIAAWYGGMALGLLATAAGLLLGDYFFLSEHQALGTVRELERMGIGLYAVTTTLCVLLFENLHNRIRRLEHALDHARSNYSKLHSETHADSAFSH